MICSVISVRLFGRCYEISIGVAPSLLARCFVTVVYLAMTINILSQSAFISYILLARYGICCVSVDETGWGTYLVHH